MALTTVLQPGDIIKVRVVLTAQWSSCQLAAPGDLVRVTRVGRHNEDGVTFVEGSVVGANRLIADWVTFDKLTPGAYAVDAP